MIPDYLFYFILLRALLITLVRGVVFRDLSALSTSTVLSSADGLCVAQVVSDNDDHCLVRSDCTAALGVRALVVCCYPIPCCDLPQGRTCRQVVVVVGTCL